MIPKSSRLAKRALFAFVNISFDILQIMKKPWQEISATADNIETARAVMVLYSPFTLMQPVSRGAD